MSSRAGVYHGGTCRGIRRRLAPPPIPTGQILRLTAHIWGRKVVGCDGGCGRGARARTYGWEKELDTPPLRRYIKSTNWRLPGRIGSGVRHTTSLRRTQARKKGKTTLTQKEIIEAIHNGSLTAAEKYKEWSGDWTIFDSGVEGILVAYIAKALHESQGNSESLLLEVPFKYIQEWSGASRSRGRPPGTLKGGNRMDIVLFNALRWPTCAIEVKRAWDPGLEKTWESEVNGNCLKDMRRLHDLVVSCSHQKRGTLARGFLTVLLQESDKKKEKIKNFVRGKFPREGDSVDIRIHDGEERGEARGGLVPFSIEFFSQKRRRD